MIEPKDSTGGIPTVPAPNAAQARLAVYKRALKRSMRRVAAYRRRLAPKPYGLKLYDRTRAAAFSPAFLFPRDMPTGCKVLVVLPHHHEAAKIGGLVRMLMARDEGRAPRNSIHVVVVLPGHRGVSEAKEFDKREDMIDAVRKEALDWAHVIGLHLGIPPWTPGRRLRNPATDLPSEARYARRRSGDQFIYGLCVTYRFFNAWQTYDSGEHDPNRQRVAPADQRAFNALMHEESPDIVLLPDQMDPHPSHRTTREIALEALRSHLAQMHAAGARRVVTLMEYASFHLLTPPRYNVWAMAPKDMAQTKTEANRVFRLQKTHDYEMDQIMAERVVSMAAIDEFNFAKSHPEKAGFAMRLSRSAPSELPATITAESFTVSTLRVVTRRGLPVALETRVPDPQSHFLSLRTPCGSST